MLPALPVRRRGAVIASMIVRSWAPARAGTVKWPVMVPSWLSLIQNSARSCAASSSRVRTASSWASTVARSPSTCSSTRRAMCRSRAGVTVRAARSSSLSQVARPVASTLAGRSSSARVMTRACATEMSPASRAWPVSVRPGVSGSSVVPASSSAASAGVVPAVSSVGGPPWPSAAARLASLAAGRRSRWVCRDVHDPASVKPPRSGTPARSAASTSRSRSASVRRPSRSTRVSRALARAPLHPSPEGMPDPGWRRDDPQEVRRGSLIASMAAPSAVSHAASAASSCSIGSGVGGEIRGPGWDAHICGVAPGGAAPALPGRSPVSGGVAVAVMHLLYRTCVRQTRGCAGSVGAPEPWSPGPSAARLGP